MTWPGSSTRRCPSSRSTRCCAVSATSSSPTIRSPTCSTTVVGARGPPRWWPSSWCSSASRGFRTERRSSVTASTPAGATPPVSAATTRAGRASATPCSSTCASAFATRSAPDRIFEAALGAARDAGLVSKKRALDSTPLYDAVATMDTVTLIRSASRGLLKEADVEFEGELRRGMTSGDDYASAAKPQIDWDDKDAQAQLVDSRAKDAYTCLALLDGSELGPVIDQAARLLATVVGQDLEEGDDGVFRIARKVAKDRVISTVDPETSHGHKTSAHGFDGFKGHVSIDPDTEIITATTVTAGNAGDTSVAEDLIQDLLDDQDVDAVDVPVKTDEAGGAPEAPTQPVHDVDDSAAAPAGESEDAAAEADTADTTDTTVVVTDESGAQIPGRQNACATTALRR